MIADHDGLSAIGPDNARLPVVLLEKLAVALDGDVVTRRRALRVSSPRASARVLPPMARTLKKMLFTHFSAIRPGPGLSPGESRRR